ncbi:MAG TPA: 5-deoxy-glucuronate isomerase [Acidimicrobiales bacterium]|jgi:5-deoxy-glucuronate isomerase
MSRSLYEPAHEPDAEGWTVTIDPAIAGWTYSSLRVAELEAGATITFSTGTSEWIVLPLSGSFVVACEHDTFTLSGRESVFSRVSDFCYVPRDARVAITSSLGGRVALTGAETDRALPARYGPAEDVPVEIRGAGSASRQCNNFAAPGAFETDRLVAVEVLTPGGNWSSYPPHKHDESGSNEAVLEEIYYFEVQGSERGVPGPGGYQRVYSKDPSRPIDILEEVSSGDTILIPHGYHGPTMASPNHDLYFLNVLAGPGAERTMAFCDDPDHAWIRSSWSDLSPDPRLPFTSAKGRA